VPHVNELRLRRTSNLSIGLVLHREPRLLKA
jgi:hypothetical protein